MSVVIDMDMPKNCLECKLADRYHHDECPIYAICKSDYVDKRFEKCPIKAELPAKHGDLIDRDILEQELRNGIKAGNLEEGYEHYANINSMDDCVECVRYADTVIEAEDE